MPMCQQVKKELFEKLAFVLSESSMRCAVAESCSGGLFADSLTDIAGSSKFFDSGLVCYSNEAKIRFLGVNEKSLIQFGAVSREVAEEMAFGTLERCGVDVAVSLTGIAGPGGGSIQKPVGLVFIGVACKNRCEVVACHFSGSRRQIKVQSVNKAVSVALEMIDI